MTFLRLNNAADLPSSLRGGVVAIGNFDGVHRGHQAVLCEALQKADEKSVPAIVLTFEPHPRTFFKPTEPVFRLTNAETKASLLQHMGFDCVVEHSFDSDLSGLSAEQFIRLILVDQLGVSHVVTGYDFHFGKGRQGNPEFLSQTGKSLGFSTSKVEQFSDEGSEPVSSSRIRERLAAGELAEANGLLGYVWRAKGTVIKGKQLGRTLGYPTANISLPGETMLAHGIYAVRVRLQDGTVHDGVASYGRRPTFDNGEALLESFLFDFSGDLYDQEITVFLYSWLRGEEKFEDIDALVRQMDKDSEESRAVLSSFGPEQGFWPTIQC